MHAAADSVCVLRQVHKQTLLCKLFPECCMCADTTGMIPAYVYGHICILVRRMAFPASPPMVWSGRGWGRLACAERGQEGRDLTQALRKP